MQFSKMSLPIIPFKPIGRFEFDEKSLRLHHKRWKMLLLNFPNLVQVSLEMSPFVVITHNSANNDLFCMAISRITRKTIDLHVSGLLFRYYHSDTFLGNIVKSRPAR